MGDLLEKSQSLRLLFRLVQFVAVGFVILVCICAAISWALMHHYKQVDAVFGDKWASRFYDANTRVQAVIFSGDRDRDGICDGIELAMHTDPTNSTDQSFVVEPGGMRMTAFDARSIGVELHAGEHRNQLLQPGERRTVSIRLISSLEAVLERPVISRELRVRIHPSTSSLAGIPGGAVSATPVDVQVDRNGTLAFDLQAVSDAIPEPDEWDPGEQIDLKNAVTGEEIGQFRFRRSWRGTPIALTAKIVPQPDSAIENPHLLNRWGTYRTVRVSWPDADRSVSGFLLEVAEDGPNGDWFGIETYPPTVTSATIAHGIQSQLFPYHGPLKYRIVPLSRKPVQP